jgi:hypothetical protein
MYDRGRVAFTELCRLRAARPRHSLVTTVFVCGIAAVSGCAHGVPAGNYRDDAIARYRAHGLPLVDDHDARARIAWIQRRLDAQRTPARMWRYGWIIGFSALALGSALRPAVFGEHELPAGIVGGVGSLLGLASVLVNDEHGAHAGDDLRFYLAHTRDAWPLRLRVAEQALRECARVEAFTRSWPAQIARAVVSFSSWIIIAYAFDQPTSGALNLGAGLVIGQLSNITHPSGMLDAWNAYVARHPEVEARHIPWSASGRLRWAIVPASSGPQFVMSF